MKNLLFYGDNLKVLREHIKDGSVDLIYLDPPFNSGQGYNVLFAEKDGTRAASQIKAFEGHVGMEHRGGEDDVVWARRILFLHGP